MPNPDRQFDDGNTDYQHPHKNNTKNWVIALVVVILVIGYIIWIVIAIKNPTTSDQPSCYYSGDEYICE